ncbi:hypothetical protein K1719_037344 [Acacia pycnantha]|nr:hypothetical protein K1719_037344 [Acacia pycnantha]
MTTIRRRCRNKITRIKNNQGEARTREQIGTCFSEFYSNLFARSPNRDFSEALNCLEEIITREDNMSLMSTITNEEVKKTAFELGRSKAPGPSIIKHGTRYGRKSGASLRDRQNEEESPRMATQLSLRSWTGGTKPIVG